MAKEATSVDGGGMALVAHLLRWVSGIDVMAYSVQGSASGIELFVLN